MRHTKPKEIKKWYVLHLAYVGMDGRVKRSSTVTTQDYAGLHSKLVEYKALGFEACLEETKPPRLRKVLTERQRQSAYEVPLFDGSQKKKGGVHE